MKFRGAFTRVLIVLLLGNISAWSAQQELIELALSQVRADGPAAGLTERDLEDVLVTDQYRSRHNGITHVYCRQRVHGLEICGAEMAIHIGPDGNVVHTSQRFTPRAAERLTQTEPLLSPLQAVKGASDRLGLRETEPLHLISPPVKTKGKAEVSDGGFAAANIPVRLMCCLTKTGQIRLSWNAQIQTRDGRHAYDLQIDAETGEILFKADWVCDANYRVFALPLENPLDGPRTLQMSPHAVNASPFGWHDTSGVTGPEYFNTRGNNVFAQEDADANNFGGFRPNGGFGLVFDFPVDFSQPPVNNRSAAIVNLFYWNNVLHDIFYQYGFEETSGNFQQNNYGKGGNQGDPVLADALDGSDHNNASFLTPPDGFDPRMSISIWRGFTLDVSAPTNIARAFTATGAEFGPEPTPAGLTGLIVPAMDAANTNGPSSTDGCTAFTNAAAMAGNIALVDRGDCLFTLKVRNAQDAGAIGAVIVNNVGDALFTMAGDDETIDIPAIFIGQSDGDIVKARLDQAVTGRIARAVDKSGSFDNSVIIHEYGHGVSARLTGGPANVSCISGIQSGGMAEGWSDWWTLVLTADQGDQPGDKRLYGNYVAGPGGIRNYPYTTDETANPLTYANVMDSAEEHTIGEIWCIVLWEMYWNLVEEHGFSPDLYAGSGGNNIGLQLVMDGLKMQPCNPTFLDGRDAILAADQATYGGAHACSIWRAFAKRGMGPNAHDGGSHDSQAVVEDFSLPPVCHEATLILDSAEAGGISLMWLALSGGVYQVQAATDLLQPEWSNVGGAYTGANTEVNINVQISSNAYQVFRLQLNPTP